MIPSIITRRILCILVIVRLPLRFTRLIRFMFMFIILHLFVIIIIILLLRFFALFFICVCLFVVL